MSNILPRNLPAASAVSVSAALIVDDGTNVERATPQQVVDTAIPLASQAEAQAGTNNTKRMSPLRVAQAIAALAPGGGGGSTSFIPFTGIAGITVAGDYFISSGYSTKGVGPAVYVTDATANLALATAHPLFCKADASGRYFRLVIPADGMIPIASAGVVGWATENHTVNHQPGIAAAMAYNTAITGTAGILYGKGLHYSCWTPNRAVANFDWLTTGSSSGVMFAPTKAFDWDLNGATLHRRAPNGGDPNVSSNWQVITGKIWRGGAFILQPRMAAAPTNYEDRYHLRLRNGTILGGIPRGTNFSPYEVDGVTPKIISVASPDGWDVNDKGLAANPDQFSGDWEIYDLRVDGFRGELLYSPNDVTATFRGNNIRASNTNAQPINGNSCIIDVTGFLGEKAGFAAELWGGRKGRFQGVMRDCDGGGNIQGGRTATSGNYKTPTRVVSTEIPWFDVDIVLQNCGSNTKQMNCGNFIRGRIDCYDSDYGLGNPAVTPETKHVSVRSLLVLDQVDQLGISLYGSTSAGTYTTDLVYLDLEFQRSPAAVTAGRRFSKPLGYGGSLGQNIVINTKLRGSDFTQVAQPVATTPNYKPRFTGNIFDQAGSWYSYGPAAIDVQASGTITVVAPVLYLYNGPNDTATRVFELPTSGVVEGTRMVVRIGDNGWYTASADYASGTIRNTGLLLGPGFEEAELVFDGAKWAVDRAPMPFTKTVAQLPTPNVGILGIRGFVTDANATTFMSTVAGGGANLVPVICNGTAWKIG